MVQVSHKIKVKIKYTVLTFVSAGFMRDCSYLKKNLIFFYCMHCTLQSLHSRQKAIVVLLLLLTHVGECMNWCDFQGWIGLVARSYSMTLYKANELMRLAELFTWSVNKRRRISMFLNLKIALKFHHASELISI